MKKIRIAKLLMIITIITFATYSVLSLQVSFGISDECSVVIHLSGTPREMGLQYGMSAREPILKNIELFWEAIKVQGISKEAVLANTLERASFQPPEIIEELQALAIGACVNYEDILAMNMMGEEILEGGCTSFIAAGAGTLHDKVIGHKNRDASGVQVLLIVEPEEGFKFIAVTSAGYYGIAQGVNEWGLCEGNTALYPPDNYPPGIGNLDMNRLILERCKTVNEAIAFVEETPKYGGSCYIVVDTERVAYIETVPSVIYAPLPEIAVLIVEDGVSAHTNHYLYEPFSLLGWSVGTSSKMRYDRAMELITEYEGEITVKYLIEFSRDLKNFPRSICNRGTVSVGIFVPHKEYPTMLSLMWMAIASPCYNIYVPIHNAIINEPKIAVAKFKDYIDGTACIDSEALKEYYDWGELTPIYERIEDDIRVTNMYNEAEAFNMLEEGFAKKACIYLTNEDGKIAHEALKVQKSLDKGKIK